MLELPARRRLREKPRKVPRKCRAHRDWVCTFACSSCGRFGTERNPIVPAHVRLGTGGGTSLKPSDRWIVSLCHECHSRQHNGGERSFWNALNVADPKGLAETFARKSPHWNKLRDMP